MPLTLGPAEGFFSPTTPTAPISSPAPYTPPPPQQQGNGVVQNSVIPGVDTYATAALAAKTAYQKALAQINENRTGALRQFGYIGDINPSTGTLTNMRVDPNNPYGTFQEMLAQHATAQQQAKADAASRGLGHGGLAAQAITADHRSFGADSAQLGQQLMSQLEGLQSQQNDAETTMNDALYSAQLDAARNAIANQVFSTPDYSNVSMPDYGDTGATSTPSSPTSSGGSKSAPKAAAKPAAKKLTVNKNAATQKGRGVITMH